MKGIKGFQKGHERLNTGRTLFKVGNKNRLGVKGELHPRYNGGVTESHRRYRESHKEELKLKLIARRALKRGINGSFSSGEWELLKKQYGLTCPCCHKSEPEIKLEIDHVIPLSKGGSNFIENIQPLCRKCNASKSAKIIDKFDY